MKSMLYKKKKILLVSHEMTYTGAPRSLLNMADILRELGWQVTVWSCEDGPFKEAFMENGFQVRVVHFSEEKWQVELTDYDLAIYNTVFTAHLAVVSQRWIRSILYIREAQNLPQIIRDCGLNEAHLREAEEMVCVSEYARDFIEARYHPKSLHVIHNWVKDAGSHGLNRVAGGIRHYLIAGTIERRKGFDAAIEAFRQMPGALHDITKLHIVGRVPEWSRDYWAEIMPAQDSRIIYHGEIRDEKERLDLYAKMNAFIIASRDESCSLVALEGAMLGKAVIMSENVGAQYLCRDRAYIFRTDDVGQLSWMMSRLTGRKELLLRGRKMRESYMATSTRQVYKQALSQYIEKLR